MDQSVFRKKVLQRYQFADAIQEVAFYESEEDYFANRSFIATLIRAFEEGDAFQFRDFEKFPVTTILDYIRRTHQLYLNKTLLEIEQSISLLNEAYHHGHPLLDILNTFYLEYKSDLVHHIRLEDEQLLPYIHNLNNSLCNDDGIHRFFIEKNRFNIWEFLEHHHDNDEVLNEVRNKIMTYDPPLINRFVYNVLLNQMELFALDLKIHGLIEENVLIPAALEMERSLNTLLQDKANLN